MGVLDELPRRRMQFKGLVNIWESKVEEGKWAKSAHGHGCGRDVGGCASTLSPVANEISHALARLQVSRGEPTTKSPSQTSSKCTTTTRPIVRKRKDLAPTSITTITVDPPSCTPTTPDTTLPSSRKRHCETLSQKRKEKKRRPEKKVEEEEELEGQESERRTGGEYDPRSGTLRINGIELETTEAFETFWKYTAERQVVENKRRSGLGAPWTNDAILRCNRFCCVQRVADRGSQFLIKHVIEQGEQDIVNVAFRVILYNTFTKPETFRLLERELGPLRWDTYNRRDYARVLQNAMDSGVTLYTGAFQKPAPSLGHKTAFMNHLVLLEVLMESGVPEELSECEYLVDAYNVLARHPGMGDFLAFQLLLDLSYSEVLARFNPSDFVVAGVGARRGLRACFRPEKNVTGNEEALMRWMEETQEVHFRRVGARFGGLGRMSLVDVEHTLCEVFKYLRIQDRIRDKDDGITVVASGKKFNGTGVGCQPPRLPRSIHLPIAWSTPKNSKSRKVLRIKTETTRAVKEYVVSGIVDHRVVGVGKGREMEYLVEWVGYEGRTWEPAEMIEYDIPWMVDAYWVKV